MLLYYIENNVYRPFVKHLYLFSDHYSGKNKINTILIFILALTDSRRFKKYICIFLSDSFSPNDRDFEVIKKKNVRNHDRIYFPDDTDYVWNSRSTFTIKELKTEDTLNLKNGDRH